MLNSASIIKPLSRVEIDRRPGAPSITQQLQAVLARNAAQVICRLQVVGYFHPPTSAASSQLSPCLFSQVITLFKSWDLDGNGLMSLAEFETGLRTLGLEIPSSHIKLLFWSWDADRSGEISMKELAKVLNSAGIIKPLSNIDLDERAGAPPICEQLKVALAVNAVKILT